ncbi:ATP-binding protein [Candidatus Flexifilum breve]|uniref:ATP-binding protein n=1 Tax=Candidatus Flexifilum breve TaxID=3140694 RepID=UPI0031CCC895
MLLNLLGNAVHFTEQGSVTLRARDDDDHLRVEVADTGAGISVQDLKRVFDEFYQSPTGDTRSKQGSGLGLTLSKQFIDLHDGSLTVASAGVRGQGSTFTLLLPTENHMLRQHSNLDPSVQQKPASRHFVVLNDDPAVQSLFGRYCAKHRPTSARTSDEVEALVRSIQPSALVVEADYDSAALDAIVSAASDALAAIKLPPLSGRRLLRDIGLTGFLVKPVSKQVLEDALSRCGKEVHVALVIDDDPEVVRLLSLMLESMPSIDHVWKAYGGLEGLAIMQHERPDAVIVDLMMHDLDGFGVLERVKADPRLRDIPLILVSARGAGDAISARISGPLVMAKQGGFQPLELVRCVEALVDVVSPTSATPAP